MTAEWPLFRERPMTTQPRFIRLAAEDNVVVAVDMIDAGKDRKSVV